MSASQPVNHAPRRIEYADVAILALSLVLAIPTGRLLHKRALRILTLERKLNEIRREYATQVLRQRELMNERNALLTDPFIIEKQARERFGLKRKGEIVLSPAPPRSEPRPSVRVAGYRISRLDRALCWKFFPAVFPFAVTLLCGLGIVSVQWILLPTDSDEQVASDE